MEKRKTVLGSAVLVMIVVLGSKFLGFIRQIVIASTYGADMNTDIYFVSSEFMINLSGALLASLTTALVTIYIDIAVKKSKDEANELASKMLTLFLGASLIFIVLINLFAPYIASVLAPSYEEIAHNTLIKYLRFFSITFIFTAFQSIYAAVLNANNSFVPGKLYGIVYNPIAIIMVALFASSYGIKALIMAYLLGNIAQTLLLKFLSRNTFKFRPSFDIKNKTVRHLVMLSLPLLLSNIFIQLNGIIDKAICSGLGEGYASNYSYAYTLEQFITATITATISLILLSKYATYVAEGNTKMVIKTFKESLSGLIILLVPITVVAVSLSYDIVSIVYLRGEFDLTAARQTSDALIGFCVGFGLIAIREMYIRLHFSYQDTKMPMLSNVAAVVVNAVASIILSKFMGIMGISLATSISIILTIALLNKSVKKYIPDFKFISLLKLIVKVLVACVPVFLVCEVLKGILPFNPILRFLICSLCAVVIYVIDLIILRCNEFFEFFVTVKGQIVNKLKK